MFMTVEKYQKSWTFTIISDFGKYSVKFGHSRSLEGQFGFGLTGTEYFEMAIRLPLQEAEYSASAPVSAELFGFVCSLVQSEYK